MLGNTQNTMIRPISTTDWARSSRPHGTARRGFSLIEIMIVMIILITLIAIFVPVLAGARNASRKVATQQLFTGLQTSSSQFELDQRRLPGYFSPVSMGSMENGVSGGIGRGFTPMQNMLLDLSGGVIANIAAPTGNRINVGPTAAGTVTVDLDLINAPSEAKGVVKNVYFNIDKKNWTSQSGTNQKVASIAAHMTLPDLLDSWSNPVVVWGEDDGASVFASLDSATRAKFYWSGNAAFLEAAALGRAAQDQTDADSGSMLSTTAFGTMTVPLSMHGLLGHPSFPVTPATTPLLPASSRSKIVFHSAGADGVFLGKKNRGGLIATAPARTGHVPNVVDYIGSKGDPLDNFDDLITVGGN